MTASEPTNVVLCIGCDEYDRLTRLGGAVADGERVYRHLTESGLYSTTRSQFLKSPTLDEVREALSKVADMYPLGIVTFYFAGHGAMKAGSFFLCLRDTDARKLSTTSLPIAHLFTVVGEIQPRQVNVIVDACQAGGSVLDIYALTKPEVLGDAGSSSIAFLAACASTQYAGETALGGIATTALIKYLTGEKWLNQDRAYLDLVDVGRAVSSDVESAFSDQTPMTWGLNLYGEGAFARNPHFAGADSAPPPLGIPPASPAGIKLREYSEALWEELRSLRNNHDPLRLAHLLARLNPEMGDDFPTFVSGLSTTLSTRACASEDSLAESEVLMACAASLLSNIGTPSGDAVSRSILRQLNTKNLEVTQSLADGLEAEPYMLLSSAHAMSDFYYLPIRLSRLLAWLSLARNLATLFDANDSQMRVASDRAVSGIFRTYGKAMVAVSDQQAAWIFLFCALADRWGWSAHSSALLSRSFESSIQVAAKFLTREASGDDAFRYSLLRAGILTSVERRRIANPTELLAVELLLGQEHGFAAAWDPQLRRLDGATMNFYVPDDYAKFAATHVPGGNNYTFRVGYDFWTLDGFVELCRTPMTRAHVAATYVGEVGQLLCCLAAYVHADRIPLFLSKSFLPAE